MMIKLIFKNLWARRRRNGWLFVEMVLIAIVTWIMIDPLVVTLYEKSLPEGYDIDRLCLITPARYQKGTPLYDAAADATVTEDYLALIRQAKQYPAVENATIFAYSYPNSGSTRMSSYVSVADTSKTISVSLFNYIPGTNYFETFGFQTADGKMSQQQLSNEHFGSDQLIVTENVVKRLFGGDRGNMECQWMSDPDTTHLHVKVVMKDFKMRSFMHPYGQTFEPTDQVDTLNSKILIRLRPGVSMHRFMEEFRPWMVQNLRSGNVYAQFVQEYTTVRDDLAYLEGITGKLRMRTALTLFFLINLCLGVIGTFWLQTRIRKEDVGVMLSFGATPKRIIAMLMGEGWMLTTAATLLGCLLYLPYALKAGLYTGEYQIGEIIPYWVTTFHSHYLLISLAVYLILIVIVSIGVYLPAKKISAISPVDALRDE